MGPGLFGDMFDFDGDGELDGFEEAMEAMAFDNMCRPREERDPFMSDTLDMMGITCEDDDFQQKGSEFYGNG